VPIIIKSFAFRIEACFSSSMLISFFEIPEASFPTVFRYKK